MIIKKFILMLLITFYILKTLSAGNILWYTYGKNKLQLESIPEKVGYKVHFKGVSKYKHLFFQINKIGKNNNIENQREVKLILSKPNEKFDKYYYLKDGKGLYQIYILGNQSGKGSYSGICRISVTSTNTLPFNIEKLKINKKILNFVDTTFNKTIGRGECWDLAQQALDINSADWRRTTLFGKRLDINKDKILPGDIVQMYNVKLKYKNKIEYFGLPKHTAIIYKVIDNKNFILAHQNVGGKRFVIKSPFNMKYMVSGTVEFYRPIAGLLNK